MQLAKEKRLDNDPRTWKVVRRTQAAKRGEVFRDLAPVMLGQYHIWRYNDEHTLPRRPSLDASSEVHDVTSTEKQTQETQQVRVFQGMRL
jgi:hypothetical protein